jgi:hypothetical protein
MAGYSWLMEQERRACSSARKRTGGRTRYGFGRSSLGSRRPSVVLHCWGDRVAWLEEGRYMARLIPGASFIELPGNHHALLALAGTSGFD